ncbi:dihydrolipoyl dehydrogenase [Microbacterium sp. NC79]|uniref:dihydrolipoyl dehydrogenase n=1 Tax=Microbacterium sp. NC79 TaxID=2851009 RepID=UPI001C2BC7E0|nr:dihydrolipoyl dehydrogenase [Microbacterium sp. NC79]MBV0895011.1 dihydrolipoyl dehydrogenase [Microbacterium sp. NC79]
MTTHTFDIVVLGAGSGGYAAALRAAELGKTVALIEKDKVGGTCLHRGCIPTKALLHSAEVAHTVKTAATYGVTASFDNVDIANVHKYRDNIVAKKFKGLEGLVKARGITVISGEGKLGADRTVVVGDDVYQGENVILATGSYSRSLPGLEISGRVIASEQALTLPEIPKKVLILGGGVIGVEFASVWHAFGAEVTIIEALDRLVPNEDAAVSKGLERAFRRRGITSKLGVRFQSATQSNDGVTVTMEDGSTLDGDYLLVAVGRGPATAGLGFEEAGLTMDRGFVIVDNELRTNISGVWAVGDIVPGLQLAHRGFQHGIAVAERIDGQTVAAVPDIEVPKITYCSPEIASVGLNEAQAAEKYGADKIKAYEFNLAGNAKSEIIGTGGFIKVIREIDGPVIGVHMLGDRVGEMITEGQLAVVWEAFPEDLAPLIHAHPTQSEAMGEAFLALAGKPLHALS